MNIKIQKYSLYIVASLLLVVVAALVLTRGASAEPSQSDPVMVHCQNKVPKAKSTCGYAVERAKNIATYHCDVKKAKRADCVTSKAKTYITEASKGNPNDAQFKRQIDDVLRKKGGDPNKANEGFGALPADPTTFFGEDTGTNECGNGDNIVKTKFDFGCLGPDGPDNMTALEDLLYTLLRFLSAGVGIVIVIFIILAGIQYSTSEGNPEATTDAKNKIRNAIIGLFVYIFAFALVQFLVPGGAFAGNLFTPETSLLHDIKVIK